MVKRRLEKTVLAVFFIFPREPEKTSFFKRFFVSAVKLLFIWMCFFRVCLVWPWTPCHTHTHMHTVGSHYSSFSTPLGLAHNGIKKKYYTCTTTITITPIYTFYPCVSYCRHPDLLKKSNQIGSMCAWKMLCVCATSLSAGGSTTTTRVLQPQKYR